MKKTGLEFKIMEMAKRISELREIMGLSAAEMALKTGVSEEEYLACERGERDLNFAFLYRCAAVLRVDVTDIIEGSSPRLVGYTLTRKGEGQRIEEAHGLQYYNLASAFKNRIAEPLYVVTQYSEAAQHADIELTAHEGQECDIIVKGALKVQVGDHIEVLHEGDSIYYDSSVPHGMIAVEGGECIFYAIVLNPAGEPIEKMVHGGVKEFTKAPVHVSEAKTDEHRVWEDFCIPTENDKGTCIKINFKNEDKFNFAFDVIDRLGREKPDKLAMLHIDREFNERRFTFADIKRASSQTANYFKALGIGRGD